MTNATIEPKYQIIRAEARACGLPSLDPKAPRRLTNEEMTVALAVMDRVGPLAAGKHDDGSGVCVMEAVCAIINGEKPDDFPPCYSRALARMYQKLNDRSDKWRADKRLRLHPLKWVGVNIDEQKLARYMAWVACSKFAPMALRARNNPKLTEHAIKLEALLLDTSLFTMRDTARAADAADAAADAADAAADAAAYAADAAAALKGFDVLGMFLECVDKAVEYAEVK